MKILTDCDGVWLNWLESFHAHMHNLGYTRSDNVSYDLQLNYPTAPLGSIRKLVVDFNNSDAITKLPAFRDAVEGVTQLRNAGYTFDMITSLSDQLTAKENRQKNIDELFGPDAIEKLVSIACGADKDDELIKYKDSGLWWIEDKPENCDTGLKYGLRPILIDQLSNQWYSNDNVIRVYNWKELCKVVLSE